MKQILNNFKTIYIAIAMLVLSSYALGVETSGSTTNTTNVNVNTYYPSKFGSYKEFRLYPRTSIIPYTDGTIGKCPETGLMFFYDTTPEDFIYYCPAAGQDWIQIGAGTVIADSIWMNKDNPPLGTLELTDNQIYTKNDTYRPSEKVEIPLISNNYSKPTLGRLHLSGDGSIIALGELGLASAATLPPVDNSSVFYWYSKKGALRAGEVTGTQWNDNGVNIRESSVAFGKNNLNKGKNSTIGGGENNIIENIFDDAINNNAIAGGYGNRIDFSAKNSAIVGGRQNRILVGSENSFIGGGLDHSLSGSWAAIGGGGRSGSGLGSTGDGNVLDNYATYSSIIGGDDNLIDGYNHSFVGGGWRNELLRDNSNYKRNDPLGTGFYSHSVILGGKNSEITGHHSAIGGGGGDNHNRMVGDYNVIVGGTSHFLGRPADKPPFYIAAYSSIGGGTDHEIQKRSISFPVQGGQYSTIVGGNTNGLWGDYNTIVGGFSNESRLATTAKHIFIAGGRSIGQVNNKSVVLGGFGNHANGQWAYVGGGGNGVENNDASGDYSAIPLGHLYLISDGDYSLTFGRNARNYGAHSFLYGYADYYERVETASADSFIIFSRTPDGSDNMLTMKVGMGTTSPQETLDVVGNVKILGSGAVYNTVKYGSQWPATDIYNNGGGFPVNYGVLTTVPLAVNPPLRHSTTNDYTYKDLAEFFDTSEEVEIGDVLVIDEANKGKLKKSHDPYDKKVVGIVSAAPAVYFEGSKTEISPKPFQFTKGTKPPVALKGTVLCKVSLDNGPIEMGDLLTSSSVSGHAMKADRDLTKSFGKILGRAMDSFSGGPNGETSGLITVFVTLH